MIENPDDDDLEEVKESNQLAIDQKNENLNKSEFLDVGNGLTDSLDDKIEERQTSNFRDRGKALPNLSQLDLVKNITEAKEDKLKE